MQTFRHIQRPLMRGLNRMILPGDPYNCVQLMHPEPYRPTRSLSSTTPTSSSASSTTSKKKVNQSNGTSTRTTDDRVTFEPTVYVHPLSQIVLEHLQNTHHDWVVSQKLDTTLTLHRDGSFELKFPMSGEGNISEEVHRIWTSYDEVEKKHWLTVYRGANIHERFLLQDNLSPPWNMHRKSLPERIRVSVDHLVRIVDGEAKGPHSSSIS